MYCLKLKRVRRSLAAVFTKDLMWWRKLMISSNPIAQVVTYQYGHISETRSGMEGTLFCKWH